MPVLKRSFFKSERVPLLDNFDAPSKAFRFRIANGKPTTVATGIAKRKETISESRTGAGDDGRDRFNRRKHVDSIPKNLDGLDDKDEK